MGKTPEREKKYLTVRMCQPAYRRFIFLKYKQRRTDCDAECDYLKLRVRGVLMYVLVGN